MGMTDAFDAILLELAALHYQKQLDYGSDTDPYANLRASADVGLDPTIGVVLRMNDKQRRLNSWASGSELANEGLEDTLLDLAVYAICGLILHRETVENKNFQKEVNAGYGNNIPSTVDICASQWGGNLCHRPPNHEGDHQDINGYQWTDPDE